MIDRERIADLESDREILLNGYKIIFQTEDYDELCEMQDTLQKISQLYPSEPEPKIIVRVLKLVKGFFRES